VSVFSNPAEVAIVFYYGDGAQSPYRLKKNYIVHNWQKETDLRSILDEIAADLNYLTGYGILTIAVKSALCNFSVSYKDRFTPCLTGKDEQLSGFKSTLRFGVGCYSGSRRGTVRLEIPRVRDTTGAANPVRKYDPADNLFQIKAVAISKKEKRKLSSIYHLFYDRDNPRLLAFFKKIARDGVLAPSVPNPWNVSEYGHFQVSWWELPQSQWSFTQWNNLRKTQEKKQQDKDRERQKAEKTGVVYQDKRQTQKADQVYIIGIDGSDTPNYFKIGVSNAPGKRLKTLQTSNPFELKIIHHFVAAPAIEAEAALHAEFNECRRSGEWFELTTDQISGLKQIQKYEAGKFIKIQDSYDPHR